SIVSAQLSIPSNVTNVLFTTNTTVTVSNISGTVSNIFVSFTQSIVDHGTNHAFVAFPITCVQTNFVLAQVIGKIDFVRKDYDSLLGRFFTPFTNEYTMHIVTNNVLQPMRVIQPVTAPDFVFGAADLVSTPADTVIASPIAALSIAFNTNGLGFYPLSAG